MKKNIALLLILILVNITARTQTLSEATEISILTCAPGEPLYSAFGHSAIRVHDPENRLDLVYNYGTFNFNTPNFYLKFMGGRLDYMLSVASFKHFIIEYAEERRWIKAQVLNLSPEQKRQIFVYLQNNAREENKYYRYDFFFDNCATRVKDVLKKTLKDDFVLGDAGMETNTTFKQMIYPYLNERLWGRFGIYTGLGMPADRVSDSEQATFLPEYLLTVMGRSKVKINGKEENLVVREELILDPENDFVAESGPVSPVVFFWSLLLIAGLLTFWEYRKNKYFALFDALFFFVIGHLGVVIVLLWTATEHSTVVDNWNLIWAIPTHLIIAFFLVRRKRKLFLRYYFAASAVIAATALIFFPFSPQFLDNAVIPIILIEMLRSGALFIRMKA